MKKQKGAPMKKAIPTILILILIGVLGYRFGRPYLEQYETKSGIWFLDLRLPYNAPKALHGWISPTGIKELLEKDTSAGNQSLKAMPYDLLRDKDGLNLREYQLKAIRRHLRKFQSC